MQFDTPGSKLWKTLQPPTQKQTGVKNRPPVVTKTAVGTNLLQTFQIFADLAVENVGQRLRELAVLDVLLPVEKPVGDLVLAWVRHHRYHFFHLKSRGNKNKINSWKIKTTATQETFAKSEVTPRRIGKARTFQKAVRLKIETTKGVEDMGNVKTASSRRSRYNDELLSWSRLSKTSKAFPARTTLLER